MREVAATVADATGGAVTCDSDGDRLAFLAEYDHDRARTDPGYERTPFADCVRGYIDRIS